MTDAQTPSPELLAEIAKFTDGHRGRLYMPLPHPAFAHIPATRSTLRLDLIRPHLDRHGGTALDIGTHMGTFAHFLEDGGYDVTAVEHNKSYAFIAEGVRDLAGKRFKVVRGSVFDLEAPRFDVVLALNIFHHFLKDQKRFEALEAFLARLEAQTMFFQAHDQGEDQMADAYRNMDQEAFVRFISERARLPRVEAIGNEKKRTLYKLSRA